MVDPSKIDWSFMKSGTSLIPDTSVSDNEKIKISALLVTFMEEGLKTAATYTEHSKRKVITKKDIQNGLKLETFLFLKKDLTKRMNEHEKEITKDYYGNTSSESEDENIIINDEDIKEEYCKSNCNCTNCFQVNYILENWDKWKPLTPLEKILKKSIEKIY